MICELCSLTFYNGINVVLENFTNFITWFAFYNYYSSSVIINQKCL